MKTVLWPHSMQKCSRVQTAQRFSREKAEGGDPTRLLLEISYQAGEKAAVRSLAWSTGKWEAGLPCPTSNCLRLSLFPSQNVGVIVQAEHEALKPRSG